MEEEWKMGAEAFDEMVFDEIEDKTEEEWKMDVTAASVAVQRLRSEGDAHEDALVLTRTMNRHHNIRRAGFCSTKS